MRFARVLVLVCVAYAATSCEVSQRKIDEIAICVESVECELPTDLLLRVVDQYSASDPYIGRSTIDGVRDVIFHRMESMPPDERRVFTRMWIDDLVPVLAAEGDRRDDILNQRIAEADEAYRVGVASPADALVGFWRDLSPGPPEWWAGGYYLMPNGYFVHAIFEPTPANYRGAWGQWEVAGEQLVVSFRELFFIDNLDPEVPIADAGVRVEMVDDVVSVPIERLEDRRSDDPIPVTGRFPFPQSVAQTFEMDARPLVVHFRYGTHGGLWAGAPDVVPSEYADPRELLVTVRDMDFDALQGDFIELPFER